MSRCGTQESNLKRKILLGNDHMRLWYLWSGHEFPKRKISVGRWESENHSGCRGNTLYRTYYGTELNTVSVCFISITRKGSNNKKVNLLNIYFIITRV